MDAVGIFGGALASELLKVAITDANMVFAFDYLFKELKSTMEYMLPIVTQIESMQVVEGVDELKPFMDLVEQARGLVEECSGVKKWWKIHLKFRYSKRVQEINRKMVKFCQLPLQLIMLRNQGKNTTLTLDAITYSNQTLTKMIDRVNVPAPVYREKPPDDSVESLLVASPPGESSGVTQLCHDQDIEVGSVAGEVGSVAGALVYESLEAVIAKAKKCKSIKPLSEELVSSMESLLQMIKAIDSMENGVGELKELRDTIERARLLVEEFPRVRWYNKPKYATKIEEISKDIRKLCNIDLPLLQLRNQLKLVNLTGNLVDKVDGLSMKMESSVFRHRSSFAKLEKVLVGLDRPLVELKKKLLDNAVVNLVVSAPPGCGKTTLVTQLCHEEDIKGKFKHILFSVVSSTPDFRGIVQNLLRLNGYAPHIFENDSQATDGLRKLLEVLIEDGPVLLVLDDVWLGAESLLHKFQITLPDYKILVTSQFDFPSFGSSYRLKPLKDEDARALLVQIASRPDNASPAEYEDLLQKILKRCNGFPLLIGVVGRSLKGKSLDTWKGQVESWSQEETILDSPQLSVLESLQPSFSALKPQLKECFMDMGSFLEDQKIHASVIIDLWAELYDISSNSLCMKYLEDLASQNLLKLVPLGNEHEDGFYNEVLVTQHDILRGLAIHQSELKENLGRKRLNLEIRKDKFPDWCLNPGHPIINASLLSISTDNLFSSNWVQMDCPNVEALILNLSSSDYALPSFIATMKKLKVLIITNHGLDPAKLTELSCLSSLPKLKRIKLEKVSITVLDILQFLPGSLKKLSFFKCCFGEVSYDKNEIDVSEALLSLKEIDIDYCYDLDELPYWISKAVSLETLSITNCYNLPVLREAIGNLSKLNVLRLRYCVNLSELPETIERLSNLRYLDISHCLGLEKLPLEIGKLQKLKKISVNCRIS